MNDNGNIQQSKHALKKQTVTKDTSFLVEFWAKIFKLLSYISTYALIKNIFSDKISYRFVEKWVVFNTSFSIASTIIAVLTKNKIFVSVVSIYGILRSFEIIVYQLNVLLFDPYRAQKSGKKYKIKSTTRIVILLLHNIVEYIFWFDLLYIGTDILSGRLIKSYWHYLIQSFTIFTNLDVSLITMDASKILMTIGFFETISGLFMTLICLARFIGMLPQVKTEE